MKEASLHWHDASKTIPTTEEYNADGAVIVAYEDGYVGKGYWTLRNMWAYQDRHGKALFWTPYPAHPAKEEARSLFL